MHLDGCEHTLWYKYEQMWHSSHHLLILETASGTVGSNSILKTQQELLLSNSVSYVAKTWQNLKFSLHVHYIAQTRHEDLLNVTNNHVIMWQTHHNVFLQYKIYRSMYRLSGCTYLSHMIKSTPYIMIYATLCKTATYYMLCARFLPVLDWLGFTRYLNSVCCLKTTWWGRKWSNTHTYFPTTFFTILS
jgi:hypothetical protein